MLLWKLQGMWLVDSGGMLTISFSLTICDDVGMKLLVHPQIAAMVVRIHTKYVGIS